MIKLEALSTLVSVVRAGSLSAAATRLGIAKSVVSKRLADLEAELGAQLVRRTTRRLTLTDEGAAYVEMAERVMCEIEEASAAIAERSGELKGAIRIAGPVSFGARHLGPALVAFLARHPGVDLKVDLDDRRVDLVDGGYDMAIRIGRLEDSSFVARRLTTCRVAAVASPAFLDRHGRPSSAAEASRLPSVGYANVPHGEQWGWARGAEPSLARGDMRLDVNNGEMIIQGAVAGLGLALSPTFLVADAVGRGELEVLSLEPGPPDLGVYAIYPQSRHLSTKVRALADHLKTSFGDPPYWDRPIDDAKAS